MAKKYGFGKVSDATDLELPSLSDPDDPNSEHNVCRVRRPGVQGLIAAGVLDSFDSLTALVQSEHVDPNEGKSPQKKLEEDADLIKNHKKEILTALEMVDKVVLYCVVEPKVSAPPAPGQERDPELLYVDDIDLDDRMFILQFVMGGTRDLESFREGTAGAMASLATE